MRWLVSGLIVAHLTAVVAPPLWVATGGSALASSLMFVARPYTDAFALNQGYAFFAPEPPPGNLLRYEATFADREPLVGTIPDVERRFPRLAFHRHFMLADQLHGDFVPPVVEVATPEEAEVHRLRRNRYETKRDAFANHLKATLGAESVTIRRVVHAVRPWEMARSGVTARDERLYQVLPEDASWAPPFPSEAIGPGRWPPPGQPEGVGPGMVAPAAAWDQGPMAGAGILRPNPGWVAPPDFGPVAPGVMRPSRPSRPEPAAEELR